MFRHKSSKISRTKDAFPDNTRSGADDRNNEREASMASPETFDNETQRFGNPGPDSLITGIVHRNPLGSLGKKLRYRVLPRGTLESILRSQKMVAIFSELFRIDG